LDGIQSDVDPLGGGGGGEQQCGIQFESNANAHRIQPELAKSPSERGKYLSPELFGKPASKTVVEVPAGVAQP